MDILSIITLIIVILLAVGLGIGAYYIVKYVRRLPSEIGNKMKAARGLAGRMQKEYDNLARKDFNDLIQQNPVLLEMFPQTLPKAIEKDQQPYAISSIIGLIGPALLNLAAGNAGGALESLDIAKFLPMFLQGFSKFREQVKANYKKPEEKETEKKGKDVLAMPKVESI